jgi:hypothetical protein
MPKIKPIADPKLLEREAIAVAVARSFTGNHCLQSLDGIHSVNRYESDHPKGMHWATRMAALQAEQCCDTQRHLSDAKFSPKHVQRTRLATVEHSDGYGLS